MHQAVLVAEKISLQHITFVRAVTTLDMASFQTQWP